jgi:hypothetical protein
VYIACASTHIQPLCLRLPWVRSLVRERRRADKQLKQILSELRSLLSAHVLYYFLIKILSELDRVISNHLEIRKQLFLSPLIPMTSQPGVVFRTEKRSKWEPRLSMKSLGKMCRQAKSTYQGLLRHPCYVSARPPFPSG